MPTKKTLVLVDDNKDTLTILKHGLEANNYDVMAFDNPLEALEYLKHVSGPEVLISDIRMPAITGFELARQVNKAHPDMLIILMTSFEIHRSEFEKIFPSTKIDALVNKPVSINKLVDAVNVLVSSRRVGKGAGLP